MNYNAIFDMDGTLIDSIYVYPLAGKIITEKLGIRENTDFAEKLITRTAKEMAKIAINEHCVKIEEEKIVDEINKTLYDFYATKIKRKNGTVEFLEFLKSNNVKIALLTASDRDISIPCLEQNNLVKYFDELVFCSEHNTSKREKDIFIKTAKLLGSNPENTFVFEDSLYAIKTAKNAGFRVIGVYDEWCKSEINEIKNLSEMYSQNYNDILLYFKNLIFKNS